MVDTNCKNEGRESFMNWLRCVAGAGMFSNERIIEVHVPVGWRTVYVVPADHVQGDGEEGKVRVTVLDRKDGKWATLPTVYKDTIPIEESDVVPV